MNVNFYPSPIETETATESVSVTGLDAAIRLLASRGYTTQGQVEDTDGPGCLAVFYTGHPSETTPVAFVEIDTEIWHACDGMGSEEEYEVDTGKEAAQEYVDAGDFTPSAGEGTT